MFALKSILLMSDPTHTVVVGAKTYATASENKSYERRTAKKSHTHTQCQPSNNNSHNYMADDNGGGYDDGDRTVQEQRWHCAHGAAAQICSYNVDTHIV